MNEQIALERILKELLLIKTELEAFTSETYSIGWESAKIGLGFWGVVFSSLILISFTLRAYNQVD